MNKRSVTWSRLAAALIVAVGLQVAWGVFLAYTSAMVYSMWLTGNQYYETLGITKDGTPVISSRSYTNYLDWSYRTLDGKPLPVQKDEDFITPAMLAEPLKPPRFYEYPIAWGSRVDGISMEQPIKAAWYIVRDGRPDGRCYLAAYDEKSKLCIGYIGRKGFRRTLPPEDERFAIGRSTLTWGTGAVATLSTLQPGGFGSSYGPSFAATNQRIPEWLLFLIDGDKLMEIDLRERSVRPIFESKGLVSVTMLLEQKAAAAEDEIRQVPRVAARTRDRIVVLDPPTGVLREYALPEQAREKSLQIYPLLDDQLVIQWADNYYAPYLMWLKTDGSLAREEKVTIAGYRGSGTDAAWVAVAAAPLPIGWTSGVFLFDPIAKLNRRTASTYAQAVSSNMEAIWVALVGVLVIGALLAAWTYRLQRKYHWPATGLWCAFVFLLGGPGFLAYWFEHRRPKLEACRDCAQIVPRDRDACAVCRTPFPAPPLLGTEIFA
jgi:hypothetical protein